MGLLGSTHPLIRKAGLLTLSNISKTCGYRNIPELINKNSDHFAFYISLRMKHCKYEEGDLNVLQAIINQSTVEMLPSILDVMGEVSALWYLSERL